MLTTTFRTGHGVPMTSRMSVAEFPRRGRKFCPRCDAVMLTVRQLEAHIVECPARTNDDGQLPDELSRSAAP